MSETPQPLAGIRVIELSHMIMGPVVGAILAELGADVVKIEPLGGDNTRNLPGSGAGYFPMYNRSKRSVCFNLKDDAGLDLTRRLIDRADVLVENFRSGTLDALGLDYESLRARNPRLIYCAEKGFLAGPYEHRTALDEVVQMMAGLSYMTGPPGRPLRAGASVVDVTGGMFGVIAILSALEERHRTGCGRKVTSALFETAVYLVGQHMAQLAVTGVPAPPMPVRLSAWAIYDVFESSEGEQVFVGAVSDGLWQKFCAAFDLRALGEDPRYRTNAQRVAARDELLPQVRARLRLFTKAELMARLEQTGMPFAPIGKPEDLFDDPHLRASGGLMRTQLPGGGETRLPILPIEMDGARPVAGGALPSAGEHTEQVLREMGISESELRELVANGVVGP